MATLSESLVVKIAADTTDLQRGVKKAEDTTVKAGKKMADYFTIRPLRPHWRNFFPGGEVIDLYPEPERMDAELEKAGADPARFHRFLDYSGQLYDLVNRGYFEEGLDNAADFRRFYGLWDFRKFDLLRTMHGSVAPM